MGKIFHIMSDDKSYDERGYGQRGYEQDEEHLLEKAFKEGCEHGFEEKIEKLKEKYK